MKGELLIEAIAGSVEASRAASELTENESDIEHNQIRNHIYNLLSKNAFENLHQSERFCDGQKAFFFLFARTTQ